MRGLILYKSNLGSTKAYADWIHNETGYQVESIPNFTPQHLPGFDPIIIGSNVRTGFLSAGAWIRRNWPLMSGKRVLLFTVSGTQPNDTGYQYQVLMRSLPEKIISSTTYLHLPGRFSAGALPLPQRVVRALAIRYGKDPSIRQLLGADYDHVNIENIAPIVAWVRELERQG